MHEDEGGDNVVEFMKGIGEKKVVHLTFTDVDIEKLKEFLSNVGPDDYEVRQDALGAAISYWSTDQTGAGMGNILSTAEDFYTFLNGGGDDAPVDAA